MAGAAKASAPAVGRIATTIGMKLAKSRTLRWRVRRRVTKSVEFEIPGRLYASWLKDIDVATLGEVLESAGPLLARGLDSRLSSDARWRENFERHSRSLTLVKKTYLAMAALCSEADARTLNASWATIRHGELVALLADLVGPAVGLSRADLADLLYRQTEARTDVRLASFGIEPELVEVALATYRRRMPAVEPGTVVVLVGPYGSGKSELAELWFHDRVDDFRSDISVCRPIWFHASELTSRSVQDEVARRSGMPEGAPSRLALVIDGLDEVDSASAARIVAQSEALTRATRGARVLLTCRPGVLAGGGKSHVHHDGLSRAEAVTLIETIAGSARATWSWDPSLIDAVRRPFFALAAGVFVRDGERPAGQADLIGRLVERALATPSASTVAIRDKATFDLLAKLAISTTASGNASDGLTFQERQQVLGTTLVHEVGGRIEFALPIFQQWFAGTAIVSDLSLVEGAVTSDSDFDRWQWALAVACLASSPAQLDSILRICLTANPGAGAWVLGQVAAGHQWYRSEGDDFDASSAGPRLLAATRTWISALGPLAPEVFPVTDPVQPIGLGVRIEGKRLTTGWLRHVPPQDCLAELPDDVHPLAPIGDEWWPDRSGGVAEGDEWPWILLRKRISGAMLRILDNHPLVGGPGGVWQEESRYRALRIVLNDRSILYPDINRVEALGVVEEKLNSFPEPENVTWSFGAGGTVSGEQMLDLAEWLTGLTNESIERPLPAPDRSHPAGGMIWDYYSDARLQTFCAEMLGKGCEAYDEAATGLFSRFSWSLGTGQPGAFGVLAELAFQSGGPRGRMPVINRSVIPLDLMDSEIRGWGTPLIRSTNGRAAVSLATDQLRTDQGFHDRMARLFDDLGPKASGLGAFRRGPGWSGSIVDQTHHPRPASLVAAKWIWDDLKKFDLADGTFPQLRN